MQHTSYSSPLNTLSDVLNGQTGEVKDFQDGLSDHKSLALRNSKEAYGDSMAAEPLRVN